MDQWVPCLPCKPDVLSSVPKLQVKSGCSGIHLSSQHLCSKVGDREWRIGQKLAGFLALNIVDRISNEKFSLNQVEGKKQLSKVVLYCIFMSR